MPLGIKGAFARFHLNFSLKLLQALPFYAGHTATFIMRGSGVVFTHSVKGTHSKTSLSLNNAGYATLSVIAFTK